MTTPIEVIISKGSAFSHNVWLEPKETAVVAVIRGKPFLLRLWKFRDWAKAVGLFFESEGLINPFE